jgi:hypothetical protein
MSHTNAQLIAAGYVPRARFVGRFLAGAGLPAAPASPGIQAVAREARRLSLTIFNAGTGDGYWDHEPNVAGTEAVIPAGAARNWDAGPSNALWLAGATGADLRVEETVLVHPDSVL